MVFPTRCSFQITLFLFYTVCFHVSETEGRGVKDVRLVGSMIPLEGRVEVYYEGEWGTVCNNGWTSSSTNLGVVCRELGFSKGRAVNTKYPGTGTIWLDAVACSGNEESIVDCPHKSWGDSDCRHSQDVSVQCDVCQKPIISSQDNLVSDWSFTATSFRENDPPQSARLRSTGAWCLPELRNMEFTHFLEVELPRLYLVSAVATLGGVTTANYVRSYQLVYSLDRNEWNPASVDGKEDIQGNSGSGNEYVVTRNLDNTIRARFLRFIPLTWGSVACMRIEICGRKLPHSPTVLVKVKSSSIVVSWSKPDPGDEAIKKYYVRYWKIRKGKDSQKKFESTATSAVIVSNLSPYTKYQLEVSGVSELGEGLSRSYTFRTLEAAPSGSPTRITSTLLGTTAINITWAPPDEDKRNGVITGYVICLPEQANNQENCEDPIEVPSSKPWYILRDMDFSVEHAVHVRAKTAVGNGPIGAGTTGVLEYTAPEGVASSLIIAVTFGSLLLAIIVIVTLAAKGVILKSFVAALRKLTSSQITLSTTSSKKKQESPYDESVGPSKKSTTADSLYKSTTADSLYNSSTTAQHKEVIYETFTDVRKSMALIDEGNIYAENNILNQDNLIQNVTLQDSRYLAVNDSYDHNMAPKISQQPLQQLADFRGNDNPNDRNTQYVNIQRDQYESNPRDLDVNTARDQDADSTGSSLMPSVDHKLEDIPRDQNVDAERDQSADISQDESMEGWQDQDMDFTSISSPQIGDTEHELEVNKLAETTNEYDAGSIDTSFPELYDQVYDVQPGDEITNEPCEQSVEYRDIPLPNDLGQHFKDDLATDPSNPTSVHEQYESQSYPMPRDNDNPVDGDVVYDTRDQDVDSTNLSFGDGVHVENYDPYDPYDPYDQGNVSVSIPVPEHFQKNQPYSSEDQGHFMENQECFAENEECTSGADDHFLENEDTYEVHNQKLGEDVGMEDSGEPSAQPYQFSFPQPLFSRSRK